MIALNDAVADAPRPLRTRSPRKAGDQSSRCAQPRVAKSKDAGKTKVSFYLDAATADKLAVSSILRRVDQSDVANEILTRALSSVTFYDKPPRPSDQALPVTEDRPDVAA